MSQEPAKPLEVAIIGGGIIGLALAVGLHRRKVSFTLYERAAALGELGYGVGCTSNAERAMAMLDPRIRQVWRTVATDIEFRYVDGFNEPDQDPRNTALGTIFKLSTDDFSVGLRSSFLAEMERLIPSDRIKLGKKLVSVQTRSDKPVVLEFQDGSTAEADVVVGCDGIRSRVRHVMFGPGPRAQYTHTFGFRGLIPMPSAREALGDGKTSVSVVHCGPGGQVITFPVGHGSVINFVAYTHDPAEWPGTTNGSGKDGEGETEETQTLPEVSDVQRYTQPATRDEALHVFRDLGPTVRTFVSLLPDKLDKWGIFDMLDSPAPSFAQGPLCLAGDAAHASSPHHGAGMGMGVEDALLLAELFAGVAGRAGPPSSSTMVTEALNVYSAARYERTMWLVASSREMSELYQWRHPKCGSDKEKMQAEFEPRMRRICDYDLETMVSDALATLEQRLKSH